MKPLVSQSGVAGRGAAEPCNFLEGALGVFVRIGQSMGSGGCTRKARMSPAMLSVSSHPAACWKKAKGGTGEPFWR